MLTTPRTATVTSTPSNRCYCNDDNFGKGCHFTGDHKEVSYFNDGSSEDCYSNVDIFENGCYVNNGHTEDGFFNGQGAIKTLY